MYATLSSSFSRSIAISPITLDAISFLPSRCNSFSMSLTSLEIDSNLKRAFGACDSK